jgi:hypothetical protein
VNIGGVISLNIAKGLEEVRKIWFDSCVKLLRESAKKNSLDIHLVTIRLGGEGDLAIRAYQLLLVSNCLAKYTYIPPSQGKDFADILYAQVCGTKVETILSFLSRYHEVTDSGTQLFRFSSDVAKYITGNESPLAESTLLASTLLPFAVMNHLVVASCFADDKTVKKLESELNNEGSS